MVSISTITSGVTIYRYGKLRILNFVEFQAAGKIPEIYLPSGDFPSDYVVGAIVTNGGTSLGWATLWSYGGVYLYNRIDSPLSGKASGSISWIVK